MRIFTDKLESADDYKIVERTNILFVCRSLIRIIDTLFTYASKQKKIYYDCIVLQYDIFIFSFMHNIQGVLKSHYNYKN